ncbi:MAG: hypothetical protein ACO2PO_18700 [Candidatus Calescibacterium sp.]|jgi:hypothetical protein
MEKKRYIFGLILGSFLIFIFSFPIPSKAKTDWDCYKKCRQAGFDDIYCRRDCSDNSEVWYNFWWLYKELLKEPKQPKLDRQCFVDCLNLGYSRGYCEQICTYYE